MYYLDNRQQIPKDYECCYNCKYMSWMVGIGQGVKCWNEKNEYRIFVGNKNRRLKMPSIPGVAQMCEHFESLHQHHYASKTF